MRSKRWWRLQRMRRHSGGIPSCLWMRYIDSTNCSKYCYCNCIVFFYRSLLQAKLCWCTANITLSLGAYLRSLVLSCEQSSYEASLTTNSPPPPPHQDTFLPHVEDGTITLLGATTENPSFQLNSALLSRCRVIVLEKLEVGDVGVLLRRAARQMGVELNDEGRWGVWLGVNVGCRSGV